MLNVWSLAILGTVDYKVNVNKLETSEMVSCRIMIIYLPGNSKLEVFAKTCIVVVLTVKEFIVLDIVLTVGSRDIGLKDI